MTRETMHPTETLFLSPPARSSSESWSVRPCPRLVSQIWNDATAGSPASSIAAAAFLTTVLLTASLSLAQEASGGGTTPNWIPLFNGQNLDGWQAKIKGHRLGDNYADTFRVVDGLLTVSYDGYTQFDRTFGHLFFERPFSNYRLRVEYRFHGRQADGGPNWAYRNSGIMLHGQTPVSMRKDQEFPDSIEVQLLGGNGVDKRPTANLCTPGTHVVVDGHLRKRHCLQSNSKTYHGDQWVTVEIEVRGGEIIKHFVDGEMVLEYTQPQLNDGTILRSGTISLQSESHPVQFRRVELTELPASEPEPK